MPKRCKLQQFIRPGLLFGAVLPIALGALSYGSDNELIVGELISTAVADSDNTVTTAQGARSVPARATANAQQTADGVMSKRGSKSPNRVTGRPMAPHLGIENPINPDQSVQNRRTETVRGA